MNRELLHRAALDYAARGWHVFYLGRTKRPVANCHHCPKGSHDPAACTCLTCHGFYAATLDPDRIAAMHRAVPDGLLAIRTGAASGLVVVDIDPRHGGRIDPSLMCPTATVASGGGGGHLYYRHPSVPMPSRPLPERPGVDIKADGGYIVAPPSTHPDSRMRYRWVSDRPVEEMAPALRAACLVTGPPATPPPRPARAIPTRRAGAISNPAALLAANLDAVRCAPQGRRRTTLYGAARGLARMVAAGAIRIDDAVAALTAVGREVEQSDRQIRDAINGGFHDEGVLV